MEKRRIIFLVGPTAIGKSEVAVYLAKKLNAEIISCDSMQIYRGMDLITSKPAKILRKRVGHHLIDIISPAREYNVSKFRKDALKKIQEIGQRGKVPLLVGGSGLYMSILIDGIFNFESKDELIRKRLYRLAGLYSSHYLYKRLKVVDPEAAARVHPNDTKRIVRALEVFEVTGKPISCLQKSRCGLSEEYEINIFCLNMEREKLYKRIEERVEKMFANGLIPETKRLLKTKLSKTASYAIGIKELKGHFAGLYALEEAKRLMKHNTRLYAKRQLTWFRKDKRIIWIRVGNKEAPASVANRIFQKI